MIYCDISIPNPTSKPGGRGNHPLLCQTRFLEEDYGIIADALRLVRPDFASATREKCVTFIREMDDYELVTQVGVKVRSYGGFQ